MQDIAKDWLRWCAFVCMFATMAGCGAGPDAPKTPAVQNSNLAGNWLLVGGIPVFPAPLSSGTRLTMTFSVDGTQLTGSGEYFVSCGNSGGGGSIDVRGTIAGDGSFTAQTIPLSSFAGASLSVRGRVPSGAGLPWTGSYNLDTTNAGSCKVQAQDNLSAESISSFTGTYTGSGILVDGAMQTPISVQMTLQQGATVQDAAGENATNTALLTGTVSVTGVPCFSTGNAVIPTSPLALESGNTWGDSVHPSFRMGDGSFLVVNASVTDATGDHLQHVTMSVLGGACATSATRSVRIASLARTP